VHRVLIGIGSNLGDRRANVLAALQRLRAKAQIETVSAFYESAPAEGADGPDFLNLAADLRTSLTREDFEHLMQDVETAVGRASSQRLAARPIDIDLLAYDDSFVHPQLAQRPYNVVPLAEIAPDFVEPRTQRSLRDIAVNGASGAIQRRGRGLQFAADRQEEMPEVRLALSRVGVTRVRRIVRLNIDGSERVFAGEFAMVADIGADKAGLHMSRFAENLEEAVLDVLARTDAPARIERLVENIAQEIVRTQGAACADVRLRAGFALERWTPVSGKRGEEMYTLVGIAHADGERSRHVIGVEAEGMTACPCAQEMVREHSLRDLREAGLTESDAQRALDVLPMATHNQRGVGSVLLGTDNASGDRIRAEDLVEIVESSMSSETYDLLKRPDEFYVVNKAHRNPKFVEDVVRGILARTLEVYEDLDDEAFVFASQLNYESIHKHDAFAESFGTFGELRAELRSGAAAAKTDLAGWLGTRSSPVLN
jgi:GTP cyclohydrolase-4